MFSEMVKQKRKSIGISQKEFAKLLGLKDNGERTVRGWELGEHEPSIAKKNEILKLRTDTPFKCIAKPNSLTAIDLFAGIGGIRLAFQRYGVATQFSSEWDKFAQKTYAANFGELPSGDITKVHSADIPNHDILLAGFPCQAFSQAGLKRGFSDTRGTLFFEIQKILAAKRPRMFLLENVKQLRGHDKGRTLETILSVLRGERVSVSGDLSISNEAREALSKKLNYWVDYKVLKASDFGVPQKRERIYIVGFDRDFYGDIDYAELFNFPSPLGLETRVGQILEPNSDIPEKYTISQKLLDGHIRRRKQHKEKGNGFGYSVFKSSDKYTNTISARYFKDGSEILIDQSDMGLRPRKLTPRECARLQGFPEEFIVDAVSDVQAYKQFGNSVSVPVVSAIASRMLEFNAKF